MKIRAKFVVHNVTKIPVQEDIYMSPVYSSDPNSENYSFSQATPSGQINMSITNPAAFGAFVEGQEYYIDFTPVV